MTAITADGPGAAAVWRRHAARAWIWARAHPAAACGVLVLLSHLFVAVFADVLAPYPPNEFVAAPLLDPSQAHPLGTDTLGRDVFSRVLHGGRHCLLVAPAAAVLGVGGGTVIGAAISYLGGWVDEVTSRIIDGIMAIPSVLLMLVVVAGFGNNNLVLIFGLAFVYGAPSVRSARAASRSFLGHDFLLAARARGEGRAWIIGREIAPNLIGTLSVELPIRMSFCIVMLSSLAFLGVGANPPASDWGLMVADMRSSITLTPWAVVGPVGALASLIIALNVAAAGARGRALAVTAAP